MLILDGKEIMVKKTDKTSSGYQVYRKEETGWEPCYTEQNGHGYFRVWMGDYRQRGEVNAYYLHIIVYAYSCGWKGRDIMPKQVVHHMDGNKRNNDILNLVAMTNSDHAAYHQFNHSLARAETDLLRQDYYQKMNKILAKWIIIRDRTIKKNGNYIFDLLDKKN